MTFVPAGVKPTSARMSAVLITRPTAMQNSQFLPQRWLQPSPVLIAPAPEGMARLSGSEWPGKYRNGRPAIGGHQFPSTNCALRIA